MANDSDSNLHNEFFHRLLRAHDWQARLEFENLCEWWQRAPVGVYALVGIGGAGKTAIVDRFLQVLPGGYPDLTPVNVPQGKPTTPTKADGSKNLARALPNLNVATTTRVPAKRTDLPAITEPFIFSFYDVPNEDSFFIRLGEWLMDVASDYRPASIKQDATPSATQILAWLKRLAMHKDRTLLVLDGLEKVQDDGQRTGRFGHINDGRLRSLLIDTAEGRLGRLSIVITTRFDLYEPETVRAPYYSRDFVEQLSPEACVHLLRARGVLKPLDDGALRRTAEDHGCHALTVDLIGGYVGWFCGGDLAQLPPLHKIDLSQHNEVLDHRVAAMKEQSHRFAQVAEWYQEKMREQEPATLALMQRLCLYRIGISANAIAAIFLGDYEYKRSVSGPALAALTREQLQQTLDQLVAMKLIEATEASQPNQPASDVTTYSIHPAVRDGFLASLDMETTQVGHEAARRGLTASLGSLPEWKSNPENPATLDLLEEITYHTIQEGEVNQAWDIFQDRMGGYQNLVVRLGTPSRFDRICLSFTGGCSVENAVKAVEDFESQRETNLPYIPLFAFVNRRRAYFFSEWGLMLALMGQLSAARRCHQFFVAVWEAEPKRDPWRTGWLAGGRNNLAHVEILLGRLVSARHQAQAAQEFFEDSSSNVAWSTGLLGQVTSALDKFEVATQRQQSSKGLSDHPLWDLQGIQLARFWILLGRLDTVEQSVKQNLELITEKIGRNDTRFFQGKLVLADIAQQRGDGKEARKLLEESRNWAMAHDAKEVLCWSALIQVRIELAEKNDPTRLAIPTPVESSCHDVLADGLKIARDCGYGLFHIDLLLERARLHLLQANPQAALDDLHVALDVGVPANDVTGQPELLSATNSECGYAWAVPPGLQLRAEALLLQAAQSLGSDTFDVANKLSLPAHVQDLLQQAETCLTEALALWQPLSDPAKKNKNFQYPITHKEYNHRAAETFRVLENFAAGILTTYPFKRDDAANELPRTATKGAITLKDARMPNRFHIALSFPSEDRPFVLKVAEKLATRLTREKIFYDEWYEVELLGTGGDLKLKSKYQQSDLIVPFFSKHYDKPWCQLEWGTIRSILLKRRKDDSVIPVHLDDTHIDGWDDVDFGIRLRERTPEEIADLIMQAFFLRFPGSVQSNQTTPNLAPTGDAVARHPTTEDRHAAWSLMIEIETRIVGQTAEVLEGTEKTVLSSLLAFFSIIRELLRKAGPNGQQFADVAIPFVNDVLRPFGNTWHGKMIDDSELSPADSQRFRTEFSNVRREFTKLKTTLAELSGKTVSKMSAISFNSSDPLGQGKLMPTPQKTPQTTKRKVFVSHSSLDKPFVRKLVKELETHHVNVWFDEQAMGVGDSIVEGISTGLQEADYLLAVLSKNSVKSAWVQKELNAALMEETSKKGIVVLPAVIDDCEIPILLRDRIYADFRKSFADGVKGLLRVFSQEQDTAKSLVPTHGIFFASTDCKAQLSNLPLADLRRRMSKRMSRPDVGTVWFDVLGSSMDNDMHGRTLNECIIELLDRAKNRNQLPEVIESVCSDRPDLGNP